MKKLLLLLAVPFLFLVMSGCKKSFSDLTINENKPTSVPPSLLFNGIVNDIVEAPYTMKERWNQYYCCNYDYYGNNRYDFSSGDDYYSTLKNVVKMEEEAAKMGLPAGNVYSAMGKFFKAYLFSRMSLQMGDLPMSDALNGASSLKPVYDPQKNIFMKSLAWLDTANTDLSALITSGDNNLKGDIFFDNNLSKWRKVVNSLKLRLLINLSKKAGDADLNLKQQFTAVMGKSVDLLLQGRADDLAYVFIHPTNDYPMTPDNFGFDALRYNTSGTYVGLLAQLHDPRVYVTTEPAAAIVAGGASPTSFTAFVGAPPGEDQGNMYIKANSGQYSLINRYHFYQTYTGEPSIQIGYSEQCFNIAEAINRGWITSGPLGDAEAYYKEGIRSSMNYYGIPETGNYTAHFLKSGSAGPTAVYSTYDIPVDFTAYYNQATVKYAGNSIAGLNQVLTQKYIALFRHAGLESYFQYRRTGVPLFNVGPGTGNSGRIPNRFKYPSVERTANAENYNAALKTQFSGNDDINGVMWILQ